MQSSAVAYRRAAEWAHLEGKSALCPQEKDLLLEIERSFQRLAQMKEWESPTEGDNGVKGQNEPHFTFFELFGNWGR